MTNIEIIKELIKLIEPKTAGEDAIINAILALLDREEPATVKVKPTKTKTVAPSDPAPAKTKTTPNPVPAKKPGRKSSIDWGKTEACYNAGWSIPKIADELKCSDQTIRNHFKALEV